ncbi:MAG: hypothetical protein LWX08_07095 [Deltaproteobacteria bacterium]|nr:hypothetical protein [Deltaproteobacteria bacterium]
MQSFNFDHLILTVHDGKEKKDRTVPLPETLIPKLKAQLETVKTLHDSDLAEGYASTFLFDSLGKKYKNTAKELPWQWFFPAKDINLCSRRKRVPALPLVPELFEKLPVYYSMTSDHLMLNEFLVTDAM